jgi:hypothetical protein
MPMPYTRLQFIAYVLNTTFAQPTLPPAAANALYRGLVDRADEDVATRVALVARALATARDGSQGPAQPVGGPDTLKIFVMPEFFFRGATGAYDMAHVQQVISALSDEVKSNDWADWLFVFGTIVGFSEQHPSDQSWIDWLLNAVGIGSKATTEIYNFALVMRGGKTVDADRHIVMKDSISNIDFINDVDASLPVVPPDLLLRPAIRYVTGGAAGPGRENQFFNNDGSGIFECAGIRFGMEICLDHLKKRLVASPQIPGDTQVQVQLVTSCGMNIKQPSLLLDESGYAFCCDGAGWGATASQPMAQDVQTWRGTVIPLGGDAVNVDGVPITLDQLFGPGFKFPDPKGQGVLQPEPGTEAGAIVRYQALDIPPRRTVPGLTRHISESCGNFSLDVFLIYNAQGRYTGASAVLTDPQSGLNGLAHMLPLTLSAQDSRGIRGTITLTQSAGSDGYDYALKCQSNLPDFKRGGEFVQFSKSFNGKLQSTWTVQPPALQPVPMP